MKQQYLGLRIFSNNALACASSAEDIIGAVTAFACGGSEALPVSLSLATWRPKGIRFVAPCAIRCLAPKCRFSPPVSDEDI